MTITSPISFVSGNLTTSHGLRSHHQVAEFSAAEIICRCICRNLAAFRFSGPWFDLQRGADALNLKLTVAALSQI